MIYADSSALVSAYSQDVKTDQVLVIFDSLQPPILFTPLHQLEVSNALELRQFRNQITSTQAAASAQAVFGDIAARSLNVAPVNWPAVYSLALRLARRHSRLLGTRSLDLLHVATALEANISVFVTFDKRQGEVAKAEGLEVMGV